EECEELPEAVPEETKSANVPVVTLITTTRVPRPANSTTFVPQPMPTSIKGNNTQVPIPEPSETPTQTPDQPDAPVFEGEAGKMQGGLWSMMVGMSVVGFVMVGF